MRRRRFLQLAAASAVGPTLPVLGNMSTGLSAVADDTTGLPLLRLPPDFRYASFSWTGDAMVGGRVPDRHDGMAAFERGATTVLLRNHERSVAPVIDGADVPTYDDYVTESPEGTTGLGGGVTAVILDRGRYVETRPRLAGTSTNCAGGPTPWGSWLTCEEAILRGSLIGAEDHGYVFEVPAFERASARPIIDMGFFRHEAVAVDPASGVVYLTEDSGPHSGFYRFIPNDLGKRPGALEAGGSLGMLKVRGVDHADLRTAPTGSAFDVDWVPIAEPNADPENLVPYGDTLPIVGTGKSGPFLQGEAQGAALFARGEGAWHHDGVIYWVDTAGGPAGAGTVWVYDPSRSRLTALYSSPGAHEAEAPDNLCVAPNGLVVVCEDGGGTQGTEAVVGSRLLAVGRGGRAVTVAENHVAPDAPIPGKTAIEPDDYRGSEFAGADFSSDGQTLFVNVQTPGVTFAITGPWESLG